MLGSTQSGDRTSAHRAKLPEGFFREFMEQIAAGSPSRLDALRNLKVSNVDIAFASAFGSLISGSLLVGFIQHLNGADIWIALSAAVPALAGLVQIPGAIWGRGFPYYRRFIQVGGWAWRLFHLPLVFLPLLPFSEGLRLAAMILCIGMAAFSIGIVQPIYNDWIAEMVPSASRGYYFSRRLLIATVSGASTGLVGGFALDRFRAAGQEALGFTCIFGLGWILGMISMAFFLKMQDFPRPKPVMGSLKEKLRQMVSPAKDRNYRMFLLFVLVFSVSQGFAGQYFAAYSREVLDLPFTVLQLFGISHTVSVILFVKMWGFLCDRYGNKPILVLQLFLVAMTPLQWLVTSPGAGAFNSIWLISTHLINGFVWSGIGVAQGNLAISTADPDDRPNYLAAVSAVTALAMGVSPMLGYLSLEFLRPLMAAEWAYKWMFGSLILIRVAALLLALPIREAGSSSVRKTIAQMIQVKPTGVRALRRIGSTQAAGDREKAVADLGSTRLALGSDDAAAALSDPSPRVRRQAAQSLSQIGTDGAVAALVAHAEQHPELVDEDVVDALGRCPGARPGPLLIRFLSDPRASIRRAAVRSLGQGRHREALEQLKEAASSQEDFDLRRSAIQALRQIEAVEAADVFAEALLAPHPSVRSAAAEAVSELELRSLAPVLRRTIRVHGDQVGSEVAYALGVAGDPEDLTAILTVAAGRQSLPLRRRALMGAARLLGVEPEFYRLIVQPEAARDEELLKRFGDAIKTDPRFSQALDSHSSGRQAEALRILATAVDHPSIRVMAEHDVDELFLVAALAAAGIMEGRRTGETGES
ncbi:MAG: MFS transporter [Fimbriimonadaceae bacterium]|nr:MFS transporter [Fimbriimonadaceae bacterium]